MIERVTSFTSLSKAAGSFGADATEGASETLMRAGSPAAAVATTGPSFASVLQGAVTDAVNAVKGGEQASFAGIQGTASTREVVDAVLEADRTLKTAVALRDKIVSAYLEITKMQI